MLYPSVTKHYIHKQKNYGSTSLIYPTYRFSSITLYHLNSISLEWASLQYQSCEKVPQFHKYMDDR